MTRVNMRHQQGFTLLELVIVIGVMGLVLVILTSAMQQTLSLQQMAQDDRDQFNNMQVGRAMQDYAGQLTTTPGALPAELTTPFPVPASATALKEAYYSRGLSETLAVQSGAAANPRPRAYRRVAKSQSVPLFGGSGPSVTLGYHEAAVFMLDDATEVLGGSDAAVVSGDLADEIGGEVPAYRFSSLNFQRSLQRTTTHRIQRVRQGIRDYAALEQMAATAADMTTKNFLPGAGATGVATGDGCYEDWLDLSASTDVLPVVGITRQEYGVTAWGHAFQYCRDYRPSGAAAPPFYGAIRFPQNLNSGTGSWVYLTL